MKKNLLGLWLIVLSISLTTAQNRGFNYKALLADNGTAISNQNVSLKFTVLKSGTTAVYQEIHTATTDANGIVSVSIGEGTVVSGDFNTIDWKNHPYFLKVEIDTGSGYQNFGTSELKSVPYAKYAEKAGNTFSGDFNDLTNVPAGLSDGDDDTHLTDAQIAAMGYIKNPNDADHDASNELQNLSLSGNQLSISSGNNVTFTGWDTDTSDDVHALNDLIDAKTTTHGIFVGNGSGTNANSDGHLVGVGRSVMPNASNADYSVGVGNFALGGLTTGSHNTAIGYGAGYHLSTGSGNVFIGHHAGFNETGSNKLYIANSPTTTPLIGGDFATHEVTINGSITIKDGTQATGRILMSDAHGNASWVNRAEDKFLDISVYEAVSTNQTDNLIRSGYGATIIGANPISTIYFPIKLPQGVVIHSIEVFYRDNTSYNYKIEVLRIYNNAPTLSNLDSFTTSGANSSIRNHTFSSNIVTQSNSSVVVAMFPLSGNYWNGINSTIEAVRVSYSE